MPTFLFTLAAGTTATSTSGSSKSSGGSPTFLLAILAIGAIVYFLVIRPRGQRLRQQQQTSKQFSVGDEVMSAGGIYGRVVAMDDTEVEVEVAPGVVLTFLPRAVSRRPDRPAPTGAPEPEDAPWVEPAVTDSEPPGEEHG